MASPAWHYRPVLVRGDTILPWSVTVNIDGSPASIANAAMQFRFGARLVANMTLSIVDNVVTIEEFADTSKWPIATISYDLELELSDGRIVTWLAGSQQVIEDITREL